MQRVHLYGLLCCWAWCNTHTICDIHPAVVGASAAGLSADLPYTSYDAFGTSHPHVGVLLLSTRNQKVTDV